MCESKVNMRNINGLESERGKEDSGRREKEWIDCRERDARGIHLRVSLCLRVKLRAKLEE